MYVIYMYTYLCMNTYVQSFENEKRWESMIRIKNVDAAKIEYHSCDHAWLSTHRSKSQVPPVPILV